MTNSGGKPNVQVAYEIGMFFLAAFSVSTLWVNTGVDDYIVWGTWAVFFVDFLVRIIKSEDRVEFLKANPLIVVAAIPLDAVFQLARFARILHLLRLKTITKYYTMPLIKFLKKQKLYVVLGGATLFILLLVIPLYVAESELSSFFETIYVSFFSVVVFYAAGFEPETLIGIIITVIYSILGVMLHGLIISTVFDRVFNSDWFQTYWQKAKKKKEDIAS
ncbi:hypothetical protein [Geomicrobium sp. JCM 19039]|uniref:hypothetical protein n=1 Tax=Geomicrobium sp. JCM 19039 TaxID=1460636 RepID=UPI00045F4441|nr:hypothetical protein [Geomicrobium sp. JCM 19039]GAK11696.1 potassium voltage-gated channel subfamily KQT [Geomicrobium sp. JCM 19039]